MMKTLIALFFSISCFAGPMVVGNGTGESEFNLILAQSQINYFWNLCQQSSECRAAADATPNIFSALQFVENAQLQFELLPSGSEVAYVDTAKSSIKFNQNLLWTPDGHGFSLPESVDFYLSLLEKNLKIGSPDFHQKFVQIVSLHLQTIEISVSDEQNLKLINLQNGSIVMMLENLGGLLDIQSLDLQSQIKCSDAGTPANALKLGNLSYSFKADHFDSTTVYFNSHIGYQCQNLTYKAHIIFGFPILKSEKKIDLKQLIFQINSIEIDN